MLSLFMVLWTLLYCSGHPNRATRQHVIDNMIVTLKSFPEPAAKKTGQVSELQLACEKEGSACLPASGVG